MALHCCSFTSSDLHVSAKIGVKVSWHENLCVTAFLAISGHKYCHGNTFSCFLGLEIFFGVFVVKLNNNNWQHLCHGNFFLFLGLRRLELIRFSATPGNLFLGLKNIFMGSFAFHTPAQTGADYLFGTPGNTSFVSWTNIFMCSLIPCADWS